MTDMTKKNRLLGRNAAENGKQRKTRIFAVERAAHQTLDVVLAWLSATPAGLSAEEAKKRLDIYGRNEVAQEKAPPAFRRLQQPLHLRAARARCHQLLHGCVAPHRAGRRG